MPGVLGSLWCGLVLREEDVIGGGDERASGNVEVVVTGFHDIALSLRRTLDVISYLNRGVAGWS